MWPIREIDEAGVEQLAQEARVSRVLARLLWLRGIRDGESAQRWLAPSIDQFHPSELLPDLRPAVERIKQAIARKEAILVWGHDDLDGITGVAVLKQVLEGLRAKVCHYIPAKGREKHGLDVEHVLSYSAQGAGLVITVDCGITNRQEIAELRGRGMDVVVTDHHETLDSLPEAVANVDPKRRDSGYPYRGLAGVGVALKLGMGLASDMLGLSFQEFVSAEPDLMGLAVLGTVADRVPLTGENRTLVAVGMSRLENTGLPAVRAVLGRLSGGERLTVSRMAAELLPLFASAGANQGVERILSTDKLEAADWVKDLEQRSQEWRAEARRSLEEAEKSVRLGDGIVLVRNRELSLRALGFCAARLKARYRVPVLVMGWRGDAWVGEGRGVDGMSLMDLLSAHKDFFLDYGGHKAAAGFTIRDDMVEEFVRSVEGYAHEHIADRIPKQVVVEADARLALRDFDPGLKVMAPFGEGNPAPVFVSEPTSVDVTREGWICQARPDLVLRPAQSNLVPGQEPVVLLYSIDDQGKPVVLDFGPAGRNA